MIHKTPNEFILKYTCTDDLSRQGRDSPFDSLFVCVYYMAMRIGFVNILTIVVMSFFISSHDVHADNRFVAFYGDNEKKLCSFSVEIASTPREHEMGLMFRKSLEKNSGMLFIFSNDEIQFFWMKNTFIPLDMIFISSKLKITDIYYSAKPNNDSTIASKAPARFVLEVNAGMADRCKLKNGTKVKFTGFSAN